jgi:antitoxin component YwqK of YwqJK toxin-antitoxin module
MRNVLLIFSILLLFLNSYCFGEERGTTQSSDLEVRYNITYMKGAKNPYSGKVTDLYKNGLPKMEVVYENGRREGTVTYWYESGQKKEEEMWSGGKKEGVTTLWHENGRKMGHLIFVAGREEGKHTMWFDNGTMEYEMNHICCGQGRRKTYHVV